MRMPRIKTSARLAATALATAALLAVVAAPAAAAPIASTPPPPSLPDFQGHAVKAHRVTPAHPPQNPFMGRNPFSNIHNDTWMTDAYDIPGPLGSNLVATSEAKPASLCGSITFDTRGRIVSVCPSAGASAPGADHRPRQPGDDRQLRPAAGARPARHSRLTRTSPAAATSSSTTRTASGCRPRPTTSS